MRLSLSWPEIKSILEAPSIPNYEDEIQRKIKDVLGKGFSVKIANERAELEFNPRGEPFVVLGAHSDVLGGRVTEITSDGFLRFATTGSSHVGWLLGQQVRIFTELSKKGEVPGVIGHKAFHHLDREEIAKVPKVSELVIDLGAKSKEEVISAGIEIGDPIIYSITANKLPFNERVVSRGLDNRAGVLTLMEVARRLARTKIKPRLVIAFWGGEEVGLIGGHRVSSLYRPDVMINVDVGFATRTPATEKEKSIHGSVDLGDGVIINRGGVFSASLVRKAYGICKEKKIKSQFSVVAREPGTDATPFNRAGSDVLDLGIPCRYMHYDEVVDLSDIDSAASLIIEVLASF